ncbi:tetraprenyl-beta-curcumene synthase family protein [Bacillus sp. 31A1R]|uniref:Tetraprenyl-beta-curcumene synthase family protein n=1 Tax=Robertmurraya mangrovi TaxID=3098077 RepID=A0ABU5IZM7_9BACI|nr:tetraprenyl-beta-curcumene synthase family protein [Bacillus sp. 31A1R]MDZ5472599.1 tetraprenyl-beta-curcumene synthase family protein [Bacillus sp. 31A1R]
MSIPTMPFSLMSKVYRKILPTVHKELSYWRKRAEAIPNAELRKQALASIDTKTFHCEGGGILALMAKDKYKEAIKFIVAYQTISDYLDNLCDRSTSLDPEDFSALHESMEDAVSLNKESKNFYRKRVDQDDGDYLRDLTQTCQVVLEGINNFHGIKDHLRELCRYYCDLQIHKHVEVEQRIPRLKTWFDGYKNEIPEMEWYEFSACSGSTLGIFCLISSAMNNDFHERHASSIRNGYFPYVQGLHILLDYFIDQEEDKEGGDLNFCFYYENEQALFKRLQHFVKEADRHIEQLPHKGFHKLINRGLLGVYLSDDKVGSQKGVRKLAREMIKSAGLTSYFFYINGKMYRKMQRWVPASVVRALIK